MTNLEKLIGDTDIKLKATNWNEDNDDMAEIYWQQGVTQTWFKY